VDELERLSHLKTHVDALRRDADKAQGALEKYLGQLKTEFGCESIKAAEALLKKLQHKTERARKKFTRALERFERKYPLPPQES
jgi:uncharacterized protein YjbJ (UPF0337 family)